MSDASSLDINAMPLGSTGDIVPVAEVLKRVEEILQARGGKNSPTVNYLLPDIPVLSEYYEEMRGVEILKNLGQVILELQEAVLSGGTWDIKGKADNFKKIVEAATPVLAEKAFEILNDSEDILVITSLAEMVLYPILSMFPGRYVTIDPYVFADPREKEVPPAPGGVPLVPVSMQHSAIIKAVNIGLGGKIKNLCMGAIPDKYKEDGDFSRKQQLLEESKWNPADAEARIIASGDLLKDPRDLGNGRHQVNRIPVSLVRGFDEDLERFITRSKAGRKNLVTICFGSMPAFSDGRGLSQFLNALGSQNNDINIVYVDNQGLLDIYQLSLPQNIRYRHVVDLPLLFQNSNLVINHGGSGSIAAVLQAVREGGVPIGVHVFPWVPEQAANAKRLGISTHDRTNLTLEEIRKIIQSGDNSTISPSELNTHSGVDAAARILISYLLEDSPKEL